MKASLSDKCPPAPLRAAIVLALAGGVPVAQAAAPAPGAALGDEFQVKGTSEVLRGPRIAADAAGNFVVVWSDFISAVDGDGSGIFAQRYRADGAPIGSVFPVNTRTPGYQVQPAVAMDAAGDFVVAWTDEYGADGDGHGIFVRRYNSDGEALDSSGFPVNTNTSGDQEEPAVAMDAAGGFVVAWTDNSGAHGNIFMRRYDKAGAVLDSSEVRVNTYTLGDQISAAAAMDAAGDFVVTWMSGDSDGWGIFARRYDETGAALDSSDVQVNTHTAGDQQNAAVAMDAAGDFAVVWADRDGADGDGRGIFARHYRANGTPFGSDVQVNTHTASNQMLPAVAMDAAGDFVVAWQDYDDTDGDKYGIFAQRYRANGSPRGGEFQVNTHTAGAQVRAAVATDAAGDFVVGWTDQYDFDGYRIFAQRYARNSSLDLEATLAVAPAGRVEAGADFTLTAGIVNAEEPATLGVDAVVNAALTDATGLTATLTFPDNISFGKATGTGWSCPTAPVDHKLTCTYAATLAAASATENLVVSLVAPDDDGAKLTFGSAIFGGQPDAATDNNAAKAAVTVAASSDDTGNNGADDSDTGGAGSGNGGGNGSGSGSGAGSDTNPPDDNGGGDHGGDADDSAPPPVASFFGGGGGAFGWLGLGLLGLLGLRRRA